MKNYQSLPLLIAFLFGLWALSLSGCEQVGNPPEKQIVEDVVPVAKVTPMGGFGATQGRPAPTVLHYGRGFGVRWGGDYGAQPKEVIEALIDRMEYLQQTPEGGDVTARVLWELHEARDILNGIDPVSQQPLGSKEEL